MQVVAFSTPSRPEWRWRIVNYSGEMVEESYETFPSIATAVTEGTRRLREIGIEEVPASTHTPFRRTYYPRSR
jgi:hypothetical protein